MLSLLLAVKPLSFAKDSQSFLHRLGMFFNRWQTWDHGVILLILFLFLVFVLYFLCISSTPHPLHGRRRRYPPPGWIPIPPPDPAINHEE